MSLMDTLKSTHLTNKLLNTINYYYHDFFEEHGDPRVKQYYFMNSGPWSTFTLVLLYLYFVKILGPNLMRDRKPYNLKFFMIFYNFTMVAVSGWMFFEGCRLTNFGFDLWGCQYVDTSLSYKPMRMIWAGYLFFLSKFVEFLDTIIFVLRKKDSQISFLHVVHHSLVPISVWIGLKFAPGGNNALFPLLNSLVHTVMYLYYGLAALGPQVQQYLWWKRYLTSLQILQFLIVIAHGLRTLFMQDCKFPVSFLLLTQFNAILFLILFIHFYRQAYIRNRKNQQNSLNSKNSKKVFIREKEQIFENIDLINNNHCDYNNVTKNCVQMVYNGKINEKQQHLFENDTNSKEIKKNI